MIRDLMTGCVESRFGTFKAPRQVQRLSDNGSIYAAAKTLDTAIALGLSPCFTPVESPESSGPCASADAPDFVDREQWSMLGDGVHAAACSSAA
jgi:hypothetical protein